MHLCMHVHVSVRSWLKNNKSLSYFHKTWHKCLPWWLGLSFTRTMTKNITVCIQCHTLKFKRLYYWMLWQVKIWTCCRQSVPNITRDLVTTFIRLSAVSSTFYILQSRKKKLFLSNKKWFDNWMHLQYSFKTKLFGE